MNRTIWAIFKEDTGYSAARVDDDTYYAAGETIDEILDNIPEVFELLEGDEHIKFPVKEKAHFYILVEHKNGKVKLIKKSNNLKEFEEEFPTN